MLQFAKDFPRQIKMSQVFWLAFVALPFVNGITRITTANYKAVNFAKEIKGRKLHGRVIREVKVNTEGSCRLECVEGVGCLSYNFGPTADRKIFNCQLSDSDRFVSQENFVEDNEFLYRGIQVRWYTAKMFPTLSVVWLLMIAMQCNVWLLVIAMLAQKVKMGPIWTIQIYALFDAV